MHPAGCGSQNQCVIMTGAAALWGASWNCGLKQVAVTPTGSSDRVAWTLLKQDRSDRLQPRSWGMQDSMWCMAGQLLRPDSTNVCARRAAHSNVNSIMTVWVYHRPVGAASS